MIGSFWRTGVFCLADRDLLLGGQVYIAWRQVPISWQKGIYCLDASTGFRYLQVTNQITELRQAIL